MGGYSKINEELGGSFLKKLGSAVENLQTNLNSLELGHMKFEMNGNKILIDDDFLSEMQNKVNSIDCDGALKRQVKSCVKDIKEGKDIINLLSQLDNILENIVKIVDLNQKIKLKKEDISESLKSCQDYEFKDANSLGDVDITYMTIDVAEDALEKLEGTHNVIKGHIEFESNLHEIANKKVDYVQNKLHEGGFDYILPQIRENASFDEKKEFLNAAESKVKVIDSLSDSLKSIDLEGASEECKGVVGAALKSVIDDPSLSNIEKNIEWLSTFDHLYNAGEVDDAFMSNIKSIKEGLEEISPSPQAPNLGA